MKNAILNRRLAVCSWSLQPTDPRDLASKVRAAGLSRVQLALDPLRANPAVWSSTASVLKENGIEVVSGMFGCVGEDYTTLETIRATGGIAPDSTWQKNWENIGITAAMAQQMGLKLVTFHAGFLPHDEADPGFAKMVKRLGEVADIFAAAKLTLGLETGQETAPDLIHLLKKLGKKNLGVNFDPANMVLYDKGNPIEALRLLMPWVRQVHIKDAVRTKVPGTWGQEVAAGTGDVDWRAFFASLKESRYEGAYVIEREAGEQRLADVVCARRMLDGLAE
jgi:L-ribulose-5-phosphate 3-epimerase